MDRDTFHETRLLKALSNLALNTARDRAPAASLGNLFQCLTTLIHIEELLSYIWSKSTLFQFKAITPCPVTTRPCEKFLSSFLAGPLQVLEGCSKVSSEPSLLQAEQPQLSQLFLVRRDVPPLW